MELPPGVRWEFAFLLLRVAEILLGLKVEGFSLNLGNDPVYHTLWVVV